MRVVDEKYKLYESLIHKVVAALGSMDQHLFSIDKDFENYISEAAIILQQLGFRSDLVYDKIRSNLIAEGLDTITSILVIENYIEKSKNHNRRYR